MCAGCPGAGQGAQRWSRTLSRCFPISHTCCLLTEAVVPVSSDEGEGEATGTACPHKPVCVFVCVTVCASVPVSQSLCVCVENAPGSLMSWHHLSPLLAVPLTHCRFARPPVHACRSHTMATSECGTSGYVPNSLSPCIFVCLSMCLEPTPNLCARLRVLLSLSAASCVTRSQVTTHAHTCASSWPCV